MIELILILNINMVDPSQHTRGPCQCGEEHKYSDLYGEDLFFEINFALLECFNQKNSNSIKSVIRPYEQLKKHLANPLLLTESDYGPELVVRIPFKGEVRVKSITISGADDGMAPRNVKIYKDETTVDIDIVRDKKCVQEIKLLENLDGKVDYPVNHSKFSGVSNIVLGFDETFGASTCGVHFIGIKGDYLRAKPKMGDIKYEVRATHAPPVTEESR